ncbi:MAG: cohesin domain-containing protein, partial [Porticoccaceae bacterium]
EDGGQVTVKLSYLADNPNTTGIGFRVNFDSNILSLNNVSDVFSGAIASGEVNAEGNALDFGWASLFGQFPGSSEAELATITFDITERSSGSAVIDISETSTAAGYLFDGQSHLVVISP